jgi:hypothetical protein
LAKDADGVAAAARIGSILDELGDFMSEGGGREDVVGREGWIWAPEAEDGFLASSLVGFAAS